MKEGGNSEWEQTQSVTTQVLSTWKANNDDDDDKDDILICLQPTQLVRLAFISVLLQYKSH